MWNCIISWLKSVFVGESVGILLKKLLKNAKKDFAKEIFNKENQKKAYEFVKELHKDKELSNSDKAKIFNEKMAAWAVKCGKVLATSVVNCLREMAVNVLKDELLGGCDDCVDDEDDFDEEDDFEEAEPRAE